MANREREDNIYYARLAEQGERYEDMIRYMKEVSNVSILDLVLLGTPRLGHAILERVDQILRRQVNLKNDSG